MLVNAALPHHFRMRIIPDIRSLIFGNGKEIHYIGGTEILPPPLESGQEKEMISRLGTGNDENAKKTLIEHNLRLVVYIAKKFDNTGVGVEDLISIGTIGLIKAINTFNPTKKIKLATYASRCIENEILMYLRRNSKTKLEVSIDEPLNVDWDGNELLLSDILGTDEDTIYRDLENEVERKLLIRALNKLLQPGKDDRKDALRTRQSRRDRKRRRRKSRIFSVSRSLIFQDWRRRSCRDSKERWCVMNKKSYLSD